MSANICGLAILQNPRHLPSPKTRTVVFDAAFYIGGPDEFVLSCLRYYNANDIPFEEAGYYTVIAHVAKPEKDMKFFSTNFKDEDYDFVGDIEMLIPLGYKVPSKDSEFDARRHAFMQIAGPASDVSEREAKFCVKAEQWTSLLKDVKPTSADTSKSSSLRPLFPAFCTIKDSRRFQSMKKPVPRSGVYVSVTGYLTGVKREENGNIEGFLIDVVNVVFMGRHIPLARQDIENTASVDASPTPAGGRKSKLKFTFDSPSPVKRQKVDPGSSRNVLQNTNTTDPSI